MTGKTKTTKGWASEREDYRSVAVVDCRPRWSTVVVSQIHLFIFGLALPVDFCVKNAQKMAHLNGRAKEGRAGEIVKRNNRMLRVVLQN